MRRVRSVGQFKGGFQQALVIGLLWSSGYESGGDKRVPEDPTVVVEEDWMLGGWVRNRHR